MYFNLDPKADYQTNIEISDLSDKKMHEKTPLLLKANSNKDIDFAKKLVDAYMETTDAKKMILPHQDYKIPYQTKEYLLKKGLIKVKEMP